MSSPLISIVLPVRNAASTVGAVLASITAQSFGRWELIVVDDGSTDDGSSIVEALACADSRVRLIRQPGGGIVEALRRGCAEARGQFIARMDADDWMHAERLERQLQFLRSNPAIGLVSCLVKFGGDVSAQTGYAIHVSWINSLVSPERIYLRRFVESPVAHPSVMFRRELLEDYGVYEAGDFPEDYALWLRWMECGVRFGKVESELLIWNDPIGRLSRCHAHYRPEAFYRLKCRYLMRWLRDHVAGRRPIWLWGAGRITRKRFAALEGDGVNICGFIDVDAAKLGRLADGRQVIPPEQIPKEAFVLAAVGVRGARELITARLESEGRVEGSDFLLVA